MEQNYLICHSPHEPLIRVRGRRYMLYSHFRSMPTVKLSLRSRVACASCGQRQSQLSISPATHRAGVETRLGHGCLSSHLIFWRAAMSAILETVVASIVLRASCIHGCFHARACVEEAPRCVKHGLALRFRHTVVDAVHEPHLQKVGSVDNMHMSWRQHIVCLPYTSCAIRDVIIPSTCMPGA